MNLKKHETGGGLWTEAVVQAKSTTAVKSAVCGNGAGLTFLSDTRCVAMKAEQVNFRKKPTFRDWCGCLIATSPINMYQNLHVCGGKGKSNGSIPPALSCELPLYELQNEHFAKPQKSQQLLQPVNQDRESSSTTIFDILLKDTESKLLETELHEQEHVGQIQQTNTSCKLHFFLCESLIIRSRLPYESAVTSCHYFQVHSSWEISGHKISQDSV